MRITLVVHQFPPRYFTGTETYALAVGKELQRRGHDVDVFTLDPDFSAAQRPWRDAREVVDGLPVRRISFWKRVATDWITAEYRHPLMAATFATHLAERRTEVVHSFHLRHVGADLLDMARLHGARAVVSLTDFWFLCPRVILMRREGGPCDGPPDSGRGCATCHHPDLEGAPRDADDLAHRQWSMSERTGYMRQRLLAADAIVAPTDFLADVFAQNGVPRPRIVTQRYGIDVAGIAAAAAAAPRAPRPLTFGFFGTFAEHKAPHVLVDALAQVRGDCRAILHGRTTDFPQYAEGLVAAAAKDARVAIKPPFDRAGLAAALASIDALVVPSTWHENAPFVVLEARAAGLPVLASRFGGLQEVVRHEVDGELFAPGDAADLGRRLQRLCDEPERLARYRAAVQPPCSIEQAVDAFEALYQGSPAR